MYYFRLLLKLVGVLLASLLVCSLSQLPFLAHLLTCFFPVPLVNSRLYGNAVTRPIPLPPCQIIIIKVVFCEFCSWNPFARNLSA